MSTDNTLPIEHLRWDAASARGPRELNADATAAVTDPGAGRWAFAVADGVGDNPAAAAAARTAADAAVGAATSDPRGAIMVAREALADAPDTGDCVLVVAVGGAGDRCEIAWVGDCRAYLWAEGTLRQVTEDHTLAAYFRARNLPVAPGMEHVVTTSVRTAAAELIGTADVPLPAGRLLLCSDGVHKTLPTARLRTILERAADPGGAVTDLVDTAHRLGGQDNATALVVDRTAEHTANSSAA
ncbi:PP2C family protein-serine/threonine phosphatase [Gandjariella thermophila]|uniref:Serine/threonine protein phosphatase n=1 Tax=Gandjariella thermophila TaxID=1931992 RepID=A0A4D4J148_9PSEU|nr:protein phosphatase 2C domain-containing protein [Gandjariella thermophila]GDY28369.1 serine/threonine protein phosphatase [Gandjariella thermophila]